MTIDIHKVITGNPITKNLMKPWGSNKQKTFFNNIQGPETNLKTQIDFNPYTGQIYKIHDQPSSKNDECSMYHDIKYTVAENLGGDPNDIKKKKIKS